MNEIVEISIPFQPSEAPHGVPGNWSHDLAGFTDKQIVSLLEQRWSAFRIPYLQRLAQFILAKPLRCLSIDSQGSQWLSFGDGNAALHIAPPARIAEDLRTKFPFERIPGLAEFLENFGGMANWRLPPCPWFLPAHECRVVAEDCEIFYWGTVGDWAGSLPLYNTGTGNRIIVSPNNVCVKWDHDYVGWDGGEEPFQSLGWTMSYLVNEFIAFISMDEDQDPESPFYY